MSKKYDLETGSRLTDCCGAFSTYSMDGGVLYCKSCFNEVPTGQGDGSERLPEANERPI